MCVHNDIKADSVQLYLSNILELSLAKSKWDQENNNTTEYENISADSLRQIKKGIHTIQIKIGK